MSEQYTLVFTDGHDIEFLKGFLLGFGSIELEFFDRSGRTADVTAEDIDVILYLVQRPEFERYEKHE